MTAVSLLSIYLKQNTINHHFSPGNTTVNGMKSLPLWNLRGYHHHYCRPGLCSYTKGKGSYVSKKALTIFLLYLYFFIGAHVQKPLKSSSCYDQGLLTLSLSHFPSSCAGPWRTPLPSWGFLLAPGYWILFVHGFQSNRLQTWKLLLMFSTVY